MCVAAGQGRIDIMRDLLQKKENPNQLNSRHQSPLMVAVSMEQMEAAKFLVSAGADPFFVNTVRHPEIVTHLRMLLSCLISASVWAVGTQYSENWHRVSSDT
jgi:ankyrin repeat protein